MSSKQELFESHFPVIPLFQRADLKPRCVALVDPKNGTPVLDILLVGAGGTGSWIVPKLIKMFHDAEIKRPSLMFNLMIADGDKVSKSNIVRQNFVSQDIGKNKAEVLARRYGAICPGNSKVFFSPSYLASKFVKDQLNLSEESFESLEKYKYYGLVINCVDNNLSRADIYAELSKDSVIIDCGNSEYNGQVLVVPSNTFHYADVLDIEDSDFIKIEDCSTHDVSEQAIENAQTFTANDFSATIVGSVVSNMVVTKVGKEDNYRLSYPNKLLSRYVCGSSISIESYIDMGSVISKFALTSSEELEEIKSKLVDRMLYRSNVLAEHLKTVPSSEEKETTE